MLQKTLTFPDMQADHRQWDYIHSTWRVDIERWRKEHKTAAAQLVKLQELLRLNAEALESHAESIEAQQQRLRFHGRTMSEYGTKGVGEALQEKLADEHREMSERHRAHREAHERIEKHHHTVMAQLAMLDAAMEAAM